MRIVSPFLVCSEWCKQVSVEQSVNILPENRFTGMKMGRSSVLAIRSMVPPALLEAHKVCPMLDWP